MVCWGKVERESIEACCRDQGFDLAGIAAMPLEDEAAEDDRRFSEWIAAGRAGDMQWMQRTDESGALVRGSLQRAMPWARSVIVCALDYSQPAPLSIDPAPPSTGWIARYAWSGMALEGMGQPGPGNDEEAPVTADEFMRGADYHDVLLPRLQKVEAALHERFGEALTTRCYVDTGPIVERSYAVRAGIGWTGKNTCVLNQEQGSWLLLGVIITSAELAPEAWGLAAADRCGTCTRCLEACPTDALIAPRQMDASLCIAYLTIEKKGDIETSLREKMGRQVFGCDICQDVCPWNHKAAITAQQPSNEALPMRRELVNPALAWLASLTTEGFRTHFVGSPLERTGRNRLLRNVAIAMGNSGDRAFAQQLTDLRQSPSDMVSEAAAWALETLGDSGTPKPEKVREGEGCN
jgi:epoxyqueuosine reductase